MKNPRLPSLWAAILALSLSDLSNAVVVLKAADTQTADLSTDLVQTGRHKPEVEHWSEKKKDRKDKFAPEPVGAATVDDWCNQAEVHDPVCMANPVAMTMDEEINAVMKHMMCHAHPEKCGGEPHPAKAAVAQAPAPAAATPEATGKKKALRRKTEAQPDPELTKELNKEAGEAALKISGYVDKLDDIQENLDKKGELDPELRRTTANMIHEGTETATELTEMSKADATQAIADLDVLVEEAEHLDEAVFKFQTEVHPHGYKWWRFRWEYAFVEANCLNLLVFVAMFLYFALHWLAAGFMDSFSPVSMATGVSAATLYGRLCKRLLFEMSILGLIALLIWALEECGVFATVFKMNPYPADHGARMHWPTSDQHFIYTLRTVNMHFFLGMVFYLVVMCHISHGAICILELFMRHETPELYERLLQDGGQASDFAKLEKHSEVRQKSDILARLFNNKGWLGKVLTSDSTMLAVVGHFDKDADYVRLKNCVAEELRKPLGELYYSVLPKVPIYPYVAAKLVRAIDDMIVIDWRVWLLVQIVLVCQACIHYYLHVAVIELLPVQVAIAVTILLCQFMWTRNAVDYVMDENNHLEKTLAPVGFVKWMLWVQQLNFFFICFSAARLMFSAFFWTDYFALSVTLLIGFCCLYGVFVAVGSLTVPMCIIMLALQRVTEEDVKDMKHILKQHVDCGVKSHHNTEQAMKNCATHLTVV